MYGNNSSSVDNKRCAIFHTVKKKVRHGIMESDRRYIEITRESRNAKKREQYVRDRDKVLEKSRTDLKQCPICTINYRRLYLPHHMVNRHLIQRENLPPGLLRKVVQNKYLVGEDLSVHVYGYRFSWRNSST